MPVPITRYRSSRQYLWAGLMAFVFAVFSAWVALKWPYAWIAAGLLIMSGVVVLALVFRPAVEIFDSHLKIGERQIPWMQIRRLDRSSRVPLVVQLTLADKTRVLLIHAGDPDSTGSLLRHLRRFSREALIDGVPYRQFWGEPAVAIPERKQPPPERYPLLLAQDEAEVERLFQLLKTVGNLDSKDEKK